MKLALITQDFPPETGGIQTYCWELARRFHASVDTFCVITCSPASAAPREFDQRQAFRIIRCPGGSDVLPVSLASVLPKLIARREIDTVLHAQWQTLPVSTWLSRRNPGLSVFAAAHGRELLLRPLKLPVAASLYDGFRRNLLTSTQGIFPVSRFTRGLLHDVGVPEDLCTVVSNGTDPEHFRPRDGSGLRRDLGLQDAFVMLFAGRLKRNKGVDTAIVGMKQLRGACPNAVFLIIGEGDDKARLQALVAREGLDDRVRFVGKVPYAELPTYYSMADVFVTLSREEPPAVEGFGLVFLEAGACETAVIGANSGGIPDAIVDEHTGLLVEPNNPEAFANAVIRLAKDPALRTALGVNARRRVLETGTWQYSHDLLLKEMRLRSRA